MDPSEPRGPHRLALIGAGRVGTATAMLLQRRGHRIVSIASRTPSSAERAADLLGAPVVPLDEPDPEADVVLLGVTEAAIEPVAGLLVGELAPQTIVWHLAGVFGLAPLEALPAAGARRAALHPVQACPDVATAVERLPGSAWGVTVDPGLEGWAARLISEDLDGLPVPVAEEDRPVWHAASVMTSNGTAALLAAGEKLLAGLGIGSPERVLGPLAAGTVANAMAGGGGGRTLTGPAVRGEVATIERHLAVLGEGGRAAYLLAARLILDAARAAGRLTPEADSVMSALLEAS